MSKQRFVEVDPNEVPEPRSRGRHIGHLGPVAQALVDGKTVFVPQGQRIQYHRVAEKRGLKCRTRRGEHQGVEGTFIWLEGF